MSDSKNEAIKGQDVYLAHRRKGDSWNDTIRRFLRDATEQLQYKPKEAEIDDYNQDLGALLGEGITLLYFTRRMRNEALAEGYEKYPKKVHNSEEQIALARNHASLEVSVHELIKEIVEALKFRKEINRSSLDLELAGR